MKDLSIALSEWRSRRPSTAAAAADAANAAATISSGPANHDHDGPPPPSEPAALVAALRALSDLAPESDMYAYFQALAQASATGSP